MVHRAHRRYDPVGLADAGTRLGAALGEGWLSGSRKLAMGAGGYLEMPAVVPHHFSCYQLCWLIEHRLFRPEVLGWVGDPSHQNWGAADKK